MRNLPLTKPEQGCPNNKELLYPLMSIATTLASSDLWAKAAIPFNGVSVLSPSQDLSVVKQGVSSLW